MKVLDAGYVDLVEAWGSDERIIEAARMSTGKGFQGWDSDAKLLAYLYEHKHATPFEMAGMVIEVKAPIFLFREWHRHRTQSYNEMSARYIPLPDENYMPQLGHMVYRSEAAAATKNRQASSVAQLPLTYEHATDWLIELEDCYRLAQRVYEHGLELGVAERTGAGGSAGGPLFAHARIGQPAQLARVPDVAPGAECAMGDPPIC